MIIKLGSVGERGGNEPLYPESFSKQWLPMPTATLSPSSRRVNIPLPSNKKHYPNIPSASKKTVRDFPMEAGRVNELEPFFIKVKSRKVNVKKFYAGKT